jgi:hypothetical protein
MKNRLSKCAVVLACAVVWTGAATPAAAPQSPKAQTLRLTLPSY